MTDNHAHARTILQDTSFLVLATADADGNPWVTPVWVRPRGPGSLLLALLARVAPLPAHR